MDGDIAKPDHLAIAQRYIRWATQILGRVQRLTEDLDALEERLDEMLSDISLARADLRVAARALEAYGKLSNG